LSKVEEIVKIYGNLFSIPGIGKLLSVSLAVSIFVTFLSNISFYFKTSELIVLLFILYESIAAVWGSLIISALISLPLVKRRTRILNFRRLIALNLFSVIFLYAVYGLPTLVTIGNYRVAVISLLIGVAVAFSFRIIACYSTSQLSFIESAIISIIQPLILLFLREELLIFLFPFGLPIPTIRFYVVPLFIVLIIFLFSTIMYLRIINNSLKSSLGIGGLEFLRAFVAEWTEQEGEIMETLLTKIGEEKNLPVAIISFKNLEDRIKAILLIPAIHPGPFKTIGSSILPYFLAKELKQRTGAEVLVLHGPCDHALNLTSKTQLRYILDEITKNLSNINYMTGATPLIRVKKNDITVKAQTFGDLTLIIATRSPLPMDDVTLGVGLLACEIAEKEGVKKAFFVDAHNCIGETFEDVLVGSELAEKIFSAVRESIRQVLRVNASPLKIGVAKGRDVDISLEEGLGSDGVSILLMEISNDRYAYVIFDSNNLDVGLREEIIDHLKRNCKIKDVEVMTTDTHEVNAVSPSKSGYVPLGRETDHEKIISYVIDLVKQAEKNLEAVEIGTKIIKMQKLKVIGESQISILTSAISTGYTIAKNSALAVFIPTLITSTLLILFLI